MEWDSSSFPDVVAFVDPHDPIIHGTVLGRYGYTRWAHYRGLILGQSDPAGYMAPL